MYNCFISSIHSHFSEINTKIAIILKIVSYNNHNINKEERDMCIEAQHLELTWPPLNWLP